jgi:hypothetical protein
MATNEKDEKATKKPEDEESTPQGDHHGSSEPAVLGDHHGSSEPAK